MPIDSQTVILKYLGWIPTPLGLILFRRFGEGISPKPSEHGSVVTDGVRRIIAFQERPGSDRQLDPLPKPPMWFVLLAEGADNSGAGNDRMVGEVFVFKTREDWGHRSDPGSPMGQTVQAITRFNQLASVDDNSQAMEIYSDLRRVLGWRADAIIDYCLQCNGVVTVGDPCLRDPVLAERSSADAEGLGQSFRVALANQGYFFIRDMAHRHQHHDASSDMLLTLQAAPHNLTASEQWKLNIILSLDRFVDDQYRTGDLYSLTRALGVLAYRDSYLRISKIHSNNLPKPEQLRQSIEAQIEGHGLHQHPMSIAGLRFAILALTLTIFGTFVQPKISQTSPSPADHTVQHVANSIYEYSIVSLFSLSILTFTFYFSAQATNYKKTSQNFFLRIIRESNNILHALKGKQQQAFWILAFLGLATVAAMSFRYAFTLLWRNLG
jgi:hypothetical protein